MIAKGFTVVLLVATAVSICHAQGAGVVAPGAEVKKLSPWLECVHDIVEYCLPSTL